MNNFLKIVKRISIGMTCFWGLLLLLIAFAKVLAPAISNGTELFGLFVSLIANVLCPVFIVGLLASLLLFLQLSYMRPRTEKMQKIKRYSLLATGALNMLPILYSLSLWLIYAVIAPVYREALIVYQIIIPAYAILCPLLFIAVAILLAVYFLLNWSILNIAKMREEGIPLPNVPENLAFEYVLYRRLKKRLSEKVDDLEVSDSTESPHSTE